MLFHNLTILIGLNIHLAHSIAQKAVFLHSLFVTRPIIRGQLVYSASLPQFAVLTTLTLFLV